MAAYNVYAEQLSRIGYGYPLWDPEPTEYGEVIIGDVGFVSEGAFYRLFNATRPADDTSQKLRVPDGYRPLPSESYAPKKRSIAPGHLHSQTLTDISVNGSFTVHGAGAGGQFKCTDDQGALLVLKHGAEREALHPSRRMANYMRRNYASWWKFATETHGLELAKEELLFIRGHVKAPEWAVAAFVHSGQSAKISLKADASGIGSAAFSFSHSSDATVTPAQNWGPKKKVAETQSRKGKGKHKGKGPQTAVSDVAVEQKVDQCVFLHYYKVKVRLGFWPTVIQAAAGPHDLPQSPDDDPAAGQAGLDVNDPMELLEIEQAIDPVDDVLDYILNNSNATVAIAHDEDIVMLCQHHGVEYPKNVVAFLAELQPQVEVNEDGLGMLMHDEIVLQETTVDNEQGVSHPALDARPEEEAEREGDSLASDAPLTGGDDKDDIQSRPEDTRDGYHSAASDTFLNQHKAVRIDGYSLLLDGQAGGVCALAYSPDGRYIASGSEDAEVVIWEAATGRMLRRLKEHSDTVCTLTFSPDSTELASGARDGLAILWNVETGKMRAPLDGGGGFVYSLAFSPDGKAIVSTSVDFSLRIWDVASATVRSTCTGHHGLIMLVQYSPDNKMIVSASADYSTHVWNAEDGSAVSVLRGHTGVIYSLAFSPDARRLVTGSDDGTARIWNTHTGDELVTLREHSGSVWAVAFSPDGKRVMSAASDGTVKVCDSYSGDRLVAVESNDSLVNAAAFSPDGKLICASVGDNTLRVWDADTGRLVTQLSGHNDKVSHLKFSPDGERIVSSSDDSTLRLWDLRREA
ncbi:uncharacterized protein FIBRA_06019 [Fibroporia radiculosa]|uniref:EML-like second beta-propeller domain-containing protein n=1 Tax=Fibroporia radiculosa TaxID=599839 RepID=J4GAI3_9APHY|nr:uncharacterized protein FIBRA_06019 [Fibroporia radiculosa]CCM03868.1 predicted protein [Fibroporia radiculosa]